MSDHDGRDHHKRQPSSGDTMSFPRALSDRGVFFKYLREQILASWHISAQTHNSTHNSTHSSSDHVLRYDVVDEP